MKRKSEKLITDAQLKELVDQSQTFQFVDDASEQLTAYKEQKKYSTVI